MRRLQGCVVGLAFGLGACNGGDKPTSDGVCVFNQAYQENTRADSVPDILNQASGCYVLIDPFTSTAARDAIGDLHAKGNTVGCYTSVGTCEDWRDDYGDMAASCVDKAWAAWEGEYFVDQVDDVLLAVMQARFETMAGWGCDMVEFDNMDWAYDDQYRERYGFSITEADAEAYAGTLCGLVESTGMQCMAKNTRRGAAGFAGGTFESYPDDLGWWQNSHLQGFVDAGGLGIIVHYGEEECDDVFLDYLDEYGEGLSFLCEDTEKRGYRHYNTR